MASNANEARVYLVGTGPGDPDLLTVKAQRLIQQADVVVYDRLVSQEILQQVPSGTSRIYVGKKTGNHVVAQAEINTLLVKLAETKRMIVRLKGGDPFIFGRGSEEAEYLAKHNVSFEIVPGITAASACTTYAGIPLTHRGLAQGVQIITGHCRADLPLDLDWKSLADPNMTIVVYMGVANIAMICEHLMQAGLSGETPAAAIANGTTTNQQRIITTLAKLAQDSHRAGVAAPVLFVIGQVVQMAEVLDWFRPEENPYSDEYVGNQEQEQHG